MWDDDELSQQHQGDDYLHCICRCVNVCVLGARRRRPRATCVIMSSLPEHHQRTRRAPNEIYQDKSRKHVQHQATYRRLYFFFFFRLLFLLFLRWEKRKDNNKKTKKRGRRRWGINKRPVLLKLLSFCAAQREISNCWCGNINQKSA